MCHSRHHILAKKQSRPHPVPSNAIYGWNIPPAENCSTKLPKSQCGPISDDAGLGALNGVTHHVCIIIYRTKPQIYLFATNAMTFSNLVEAIKQPVVIIYLIETLCAGCDVLVHVSRSDLNGVERARDTSKEAISATCEQPRLMSPVPCSPML